MKIYLNDDIICKVARCPADLYILQGVGFLQYPTANKDIAQAFLESFMAKKQVVCADDYDVDMSGRWQPDYKLCKDCVKRLTRVCEVYKNGNCKSEQMHC